MFLTNLFGLKRKCMHDKITPDMIAENLYKMSGILRAALAAGLK